MIIHLTAESYDKTIATGTVLVDFWATWCGPCRMQGKILEESLDELEKNGVTVCKVNVDDVPALAERFGIMSIPTIQLYKDGELKQQVVGIHNFGKIQDMISQL